jgi:ammonium transporter, Amt family
MLGTFLLWFGWYGFNAGSALALQIPPDDAAVLAPLAAVNSTISAGTASIAALFVNLIYLERTTGEPCFDIKFAMNGALAGLVAITGGCGVVEPWAALVIGFVAGNLYFLGSYGLLKLRLDDAVDAIPVHLVCGLWGVISVGLFATPKYLQLAYGRSEHAGLVYGTGGRLLGVQCIGILFVFGWVMAIMLPFFIWLDWKGWLRSDPLEEIVGLDLSYHGGLPLVSHGEHDDGVSAEYLSQYRKKKEERRSLKNRKIEMNTDEGEEGGEESIGEGDQDGYDR